jgi:16S rRNA (cytosine1402-N4)-methyltransferase
MSKTNSQHQAVLMAETLEYLAPQKDAWYIDGTFGRGGHSQEIMAQGAKVIAFDFDLEAIERGKEKFAKEIEKGQLILLRENFSKMKASLENLKKSMTIEISGIFFDFGTSTDQLMSNRRGFSFEAKDEILDMRMDDRLGVKACDLLKLLDERQMADLFFQYGGERDARRIAKEIVKIRKTDPNSLDQVETLVRVIEKVKGQRNSKIHPATKVFQALRIVVNDELTSIEEVLPQALEILQESKAINKRLVSIAFHEGEDRLVKTFFREIENKNLGKLLTKKAVKASDKELAENPRSRSARLRAVAI